MVDATPKLPPWLPHWLRPPPFGDDEDSAFERSG
jgi:hypothetical protein